MKIFLLQSLSSLLSLFMTVLLLLSSKTIYADIDGPERQGHDEVVVPKDYDDPVFISKTVIIPHDSKKFRGGEDSASNSDLLLVVADGVGGWAKSGINPGLYSRALTQNIVTEHTKQHIELENASNNYLPYKTQTLSQIVHDANWKSSKQHMGSATCTVVELQDHGNYLNTLNVGDSGYSIHRFVDNNNNNSDGSKNELQVVYASVPGQKRFNFPHQLGGKHGDEVKNVGVVNDHELQDGDIIVLYSDGISDNLYPNDYHECMLRGMTTNLIRIDESDDDDKERVELLPPYDWLSLSWVADCLARHAYELGKDRSFVSPFAKGARESGFRKDYVGGKHDDITVTVAQVVPTKYEAMSRLEEDPYFTESIKIYTDDDGPILSRKHMPQFEFNTMSKDDGNKRLRLVGVDANDDDDESDTEATEDTTDSDSKDEL